SLAILSDPNTGIYSPGADQVAISTNGTGKLFVDSTGNIGLLAASPSAWSYGGNIAIPGGGRYIASTSDDIRFASNLYESDVARYSANGFAARYRISDGTHQWSIAATGTAGNAITLNEAMRITSGGLLGLGTSSPVSKLHVVQSLAGNDVTTGAALLMTTSTATNDRLNLNFSLTGNGDRARAGIGAVALDSTGGYNAGLAFYTRLANDGTQLATTDERMRIDSSGRVGIGTATPGSPLAIESNAGNQVKITYPSVASYYLNATSGGDFAINKDGTERARIDSSGRLLVGTSTATNNLRLDEKFAIVGTSASYPGMAITGYTGTATDYSPLIEIQRSRGTSDGSYTKVESGDCLGKIMFRGADGSSWASGAYIEAFVDGATSAGDLPTRLVFSTTADGASSPTTRMTIKNGGEVCIGTTDVHVANRNALENATTGQLTFRHSGTTAGRYNIVGMNSGSAFIVSDSSGGTGVQLAYSGTSWSTLSDERFKTDLEPIESGLSKVAALRALTGRLVTDPEDKRRSFLIAQDVDAVLPEAVDKTDPGALALSYTEVVPLLVAALKESKERIEQLEAKVAALESA
ncbi:MAG: tail fiber domain-containing protein, partial [Microbacteriaceae bacterium]|nr:tail fiber domain-containing protein [Microbacteriaceae bacterium]